ncbi:MAG: protein-L-isoaspartate(D-aspartate) O-methyltransferase [Candidatus Saccharibacteria bacterium]
MKDNDLLWKYSFYRCSVLLLVILIVVSCTSASRNPSADQNNKPSDTLRPVQQDNAPVWKKEAIQMVDNQLVPRGIYDQRILKAMKNTPRHLFVPKSYRSFAYDDRPVPIGKEQTISQPYIVAKMTELLELKGSEKVLEIGTGSGYQAAILSQLADTIYSIELIKLLEERAARLLKDQGYHNVMVKCDDGYKGWKEHAPFDAIIITAAPEVIPQTLVEQLKVNGRMVVPVGKTYQQLILITKTNKGIKKKNIFPVRFVPMVKPK